MICFASIAVPLAVLAALAVAACIRSSQISEMERRRGRNEKITEQ